MGYSKKIWKKYIINIKPRDAHYIILIKMKEI